MNSEASTIGPRRSAVAGVALVVAAGLVAGGCSSSGSGRGAPLSPQQRPLIIAYKLGAHGKLPDTVGA